MSIEPSQFSAPYAQPEIIIPNDWNEARLILTDYIIQTAEAINARGISQYIDGTLNTAGENISQTQTGEKWFDPNDSQKYRDGFRTVITIDGGLLNHGAGVATQSQAHGIVTTDRTVFTRIYGAATDPGTSSIISAIPLPYVDVDALANGIEITVDATNVNLRYGADYSAYSTAYVVLEYVDNF